MKVPFVSFRAFNDLMKEEYLQKVSALLNKGDFISGAEVAAFEKNFASACNASYCLGTGNGLDALKICLQTLDIKAGDEIIVPANTFIATWLAVSQVGATVVPVNPDPGTYNIDVSQIENHLGAKTKAMIPVHLYGLPADMDGIMSIAHKHGLWVIEDFAQAQGATYKGRCVGSIGHINATSFYPAKNIGAFGDAGAITTNDKALAEKSAMLRNYGSAEKYIHKLRGFNSRLDTLQAIALNMKLPVLGSWNEQRIKAAEAYSQLLNGVGDLTLPYTPAGSTHAFHLYVVRTKCRNELQQFLKQFDIDTGIHYPIPPHKQQAYANSIGRFDLTLTETLSNEVLSLPMFPGITTDEIEYVCASIKKFFTS